MWGGRFAAGPSAIMREINASIPFDKALWRQDIAASKAHVAMLGTQGIVSSDDAAEIAAGLDQVAAEYEASGVPENWDLEDIHMTTESRLAELIGPVAGRLHTARSRNDQVATDMRLWFKYACATLREKILGAQRALLSVAEAHRDVLIPGYTHLQRAQPVYLSHHLFAWMEMLDRDRARLADVAQHANWCPLGSGAIAGTTLPIDREFTAKALGFVDEKGRPQVTQNSMDTVADRDLFIEFSAACATFGVHASRIAEDLILWSSTEFKFIELPDAFCTGSSLMPQKKNPDSCELLRGKSARLQGNLHTLLTLTKGLPLTYNRDLQEDKPPVFDSFDQTAICADVLGGTLGGMTFYRERCAAAVADPALLATDLADYLVLKGVAFRDAHHAVGAVVRLAEKNSVALDQLPTEEVQKINAAFGADWVEVFDLKRALSKRTGTGMPGPAQVAKQFARWKRALK